METIETNATEATVNRKHKDTVFRSIFKEKRALLSLYNALFDTGYDNPDDLTVVTLENAIYMKHKDDLRLALIEPQSYVNPNMPLRMLKYVVDLFSKIAIDENIYSRRRILLPEPTFIVLYNGTDPQPERKVMYLSDSFMRESDTEPNLELKVIQLNINDNFNEDLKQNCPELFGYSHFVSLIRAGLNTYDGDINKATDYAIDTCIKEGILADFFKKNRKEVAMMSIYEFDEEQYEQAIRKEEREEGRAEGRIEGYDLMLNQLVADGTITPEKAESLRQNSKLVTV